MQGSLVSNVATPEETVVECKVKVCAQQEEPNKTTWKTTPDSRRRDGPETSLPTGAVEGVGVVTNPSVAPVAEVA